MRPEKGTSNLVSGKIPPWVPIAISILSLIVASTALYISWRQWQDGQRNTSILSAPRVSIIENTDTDEPLVGLQISNDGSSVVRLKDVTYYVDRKPVGDVNDAINASKLEDIGNFDFGQDSILAVGEKDWLLSKKTTVNKIDREKFIEFIDNHLAVEIEACSLLTGKCETTCSTDGWCK